MLTMIIDQRAVVERLKRSGKTFTGSLAFFNDWELFWSSGRFPTTAQYKAPCLLGYGLSLPLVPLFSYGLRHDTSKG